VSFEIQELPDVIRVIVLLNLSKGNRIPKNALKRRLDRVCASRVCIEMVDLEKTLQEMGTEGLIVEGEEAVQLTEKGLKLSREWESLLLKKDPILEVVAGLVDGSITGIVVILSAFIAALSTQLAVFAALLTLSAVSITNFSSFLLGGITEDLADIMTLQNLMNYSVSDIPDKKERDKCLCGNNLWNNNFYCRHYSHSDLFDSANPAQHCVIAIHSWRGCRAVPGSISI
jgi:hypothetical protein